MAESKKEKLAAQIAKIVSEDEVAPQLANITEIDDVEDLSTPLPIVGSIY